MRRGEKKDERPGRGGEDDGCCGGRLQAGRVGCTAAAQQVKCRDLEHAMEQIL